MWVAFAFSKATNIFFSKKTCELNIVLTRTVNILTTNELIKLTMLWTTGPWMFLEILNKEFGYYICKYPHELKMDVCFKKQCPFTAIRETSLIFEKTNIQDCNYTYT